MHRDEHSAIRTFKKLRASVNLAEGMPDEVLVYQRLFVEARLGMKVLNGFVKPSLAAVKADDKFQFEWHEYFVADRVDHAAYG